MNKFIKKICVAGLISVMTGSMMACGTKTENKVAEATKTSDDPYTSYYFTKKAGLLSLALKKNDDAKKYFSLIDEKFQDYDGGSSDAYIEMVKNF